MDGQGAEFVLSLSRPSVVLTDAVVAKMAKACEVLKAFLLDRAGRFLSRCSGAPVMEVYSSDCTPLKVSAKHERSWHDLHIGRTGRSCHEWLVQRYFLLDVNRRVCAVFSEPKLMGDKTAWAHWSAQDELVGMARQRHSGITISHHVWDRAVHDACAFHQRQRHAAFDEHLRCEAEEQGRVGHAMLPCLLSWFTSTGCLAHDLHNSLRWSCSTLLDDKDQLRAMWIVFESLRNAFDELVLAMPVWLVRVVVYEDVANPSALGAFWEILGLEPAWVQLLTKLEMRFCDGKLKVSTAFENDESLPSLLSTCLLRLWRFRQWSGTRWCSVGQSCRCLVGCMHAGLGSLVDHIMNDPRRSKYYIAGFGNLNKDILRAACVLAATSQVTERSLASMLSDDRVCKRLDHIDSLRQQEVRRVLELPPGVLLYLSLVCDTSVGELRAAMVRSAAVQIGYSENRLRMARQHPWSLAQGDIRAKLEELIGGPRPTEGTAAKIFDLRLMGYPVSELVQALELMQEAPWTSTCVEQGHSVTSSIAKLHPRYNRQTLTARTMVQTAVVLFRKDPLARKIETKLGRIGRLRSKQVGRITGRHAFCSSLFFHAKRNKKAKQKTSPNLAPRVIAAHGKQWNDMQNHKQRLWHRLAEDLREDKRSANTMLLMKETGILRDLCRQQKEAQTTGSCLRLSSGRFSESDLTDFEGFFQSDIWTKAHIADLRQKACREVLQPIDPVKATLTAMPVTKGKLAEVPTWARWMARNREFFTDCIVSLEVQSGDRKYFSFVYASQNPILVCLSSLLPIDAVEPVFTAATFGQVDWRIWDHYFQWNPMEVSFSDESLLHSCSGVEVLSGAVVREGGLLCADGKFQSMEAMVDSMQMPVGGGSASRGRERKDKAEVDVEPWMQDPMMWEHLRDAQHAARRPRRIRTKQTPSQANGAEEPEELGEEDTLQTMQDLWKRRAELEAEGDGEPDPFVWTIRGGVWTRSHVGVAFDSYRALASGSQAKIFCSTYGLQQSATFSIAKFGEEACVQLCKLWVARMSSLFAAWQAHGAEPAFVFREEHLLEHAPPPELEDLDTHPSAAVRARARGIADIRPRAPV